MTSPSIEPNNASASSGETSTPGGEGLDLSQLSSLRQLTLIVYILSAISLLGVLLPAVAGLIINYVKMDQARGTVYESHFRWQIRTFWWTIGWSALAYLLIWTIFVPWLIFMGLQIWVIYRVIKGWLQWSEVKPVSSDQRLFPKA